jgi:metal-responsive CopG/Arc/MetJ family transcriptional regulator
MKQVYTRNTGRNMCRMSFIDEQKIIDKLEKVSKRRKVSQSQIIRDFIHTGLQGWDC